MKSTYLLATVLLPIVALCACDSGKKGNLTSKKNGTEDFVFKPPAPPVRPTPSKNEPAKDAHRPKNEQVK